MDASATAAARVPHLPPGAPTVTVVIPALNEAANLPHVLALIPSEVLEIIVVDGHSTDDTVAVAMAAERRVRVLVQQGKGKGNALAAGFAAAHGEVIVMLDADGSTDPREIPGFVQALMDGADFAKGTRFSQGGGSVDITSIRRIGNRALSGTVNTLFGTTYTDLCYGYIAFWTRCLPDLHINCDGFEVETLMNVRVARAGLRVREVPSQERHRLFGESKLHAGRDGARVLRTILTERMRSAPPASDGSWRPKYRELTPTAAEPRLAVTT